MAPSSYTVDERSSLLSSSHNQGTRPTDYRATSNHDDNVPSEAEQEEHVKVMPPMRKLAPLLTAVWVPVFVASMDGTVTATLISSISSSFNASEQAQWLGSAYLLSVACFTPLYGRLADIVGRRNCMFIALTFFTVGTLLCGLSTSMNMLIFARALAGVGGGGLTTNTSIILSDVVPLKNRGLLQGLTNIIFGLGSGLGGPVGGWMNDTIGWRRAFLVQIPLLLADYVLAFAFVRVKTPNRLVQQSTWDKLKSIDFAGAFSLVLGLSSSLIALSLMSANDMPVTNPVVWGGFLLGFGSIGFFFYAEARIARTPILPLRLITQRSGAAVALANFCLSIVSFGTLYHFPLFFQAVKLETPSRAGLHMIPISVALSVGSVLAGVVMRSSGRYYRYNLANSMVITASIACVTLFSRSSSELFTFAAIVPYGFGTAGVLTCTLIALINSVPRADVAVATSMSYMARNTGQILGVSVGGTLFQALLKRQLRQRITGKGADKIISEIRHRSAIVPELPTQLREAAIESYAYALRWVFIGIALVSVGTVVGCAFIEDKELPAYENAKPASEEQEQEDGADRE
ncbi:related to VBA1-Vacuolar Basic Amino acid transporter [Sporisorium reilianum f. sp. reilianum]|uniref:Related to VBA1-Vacuolar Basic Amino acid transporter n=1 Tax=Sporisorium reilianum f. sp. reilianum TaxID=72559 RepID=A0A2N8U7R3_9BASI|nr:related to VBA1-Vacuolar Basic Amino acid transporter [Sporisorium reilianum f. sp. reilianum]